MPRLVNTWSKRWRKLFYRKNAPCHYDCMCDLHEGVTDRKKSRAVANRAAVREIKDQLQ